MLFVNSFDPFRGDVLYGTTGSRTEYLEKWMDFQSRTSTADEYRHFSIHNKYFYINDYNEPITDGDFSNRHNIRLSQNRDNVQTRYLGRLEETKYSPYNVGATKNQYIIEKNSSEILKRKKNLPTAEERKKMLMVQAVRRSCKYGIEYIANAHPSGILHYVLDGINLNSVIAKTQMALWTGSQGIPITTSEIRFVFRHWHRFRNNQKFKFWKDFRDVNAPWQDKPQDWLPYAQARVEKYRERLQFGNHARLYGFDRAVLKNQYRLAIDLFHDMAMGDSFAE